MRILSPYNQLWVYVLPPRPYLRLAGVSPVESPPLLSFAAPGTPLLHRSPPPVLPRGGQSFCTGHLPHSGTALARPVREAHPPRPPPPLWDRPRRRRHCLHPPRRATPSSKGSQSSCLLLIPLLQRPRLAAAHIVARGQELGIRDDGIAGTKSICCGPGPLPTSARRPSPTF